MGSEWKNLTIGDVCYVTDGAHSKVERVDNGVMYLTSKNISNGGLKLDKYDFISETSFQKLFTDTKKSQRRLRSGDVLMGIIGTFGNCYVYKDSDNFGISSSVAILRPDQELIIPEYLFYVISSPAFKRIVEKFKGGSVQGYTNITTIKALPITVPSVQVQKLIVGIIKPSDQKITLNRQINQTLEQMAQALFKSWFVDFDPVIDNALAAGNPIPDELQPRAEQRKALRLKANDEDGYKPLPESVRALFPDAFEESELGWVPEGWAVALSGEIFDIRDGTHDSPKKSENGFRLVTSKNLTSGELDLSSSYLISAQDYEAINKRSKVNEGDVLLTMIGTIGVPCLISMANPDFAIKNVGLFRSSQNPELKYYLYQLLKTYGMQHYLESRAAGTTQKYLSLKVLRSIEILLPERNLLAAFNLRVANFEDKIQKNREQNESLTNLRDTLLPKLISGELQLDQLPDAVASVA